MNTLIIVADNSRARIFKTDHPNSPIVEIETMAHPEGRLHEQDMVSDLPGKNAGEGGGGDHAFQEKIEPKEHEVIEFAKRTADYLDNARKKNQLDQLLIIAAPEFLGELRKQMTDETNELVVFELDKNLTQHSLDDIKIHLPKNLQH